MSGYHKAVGAYWNAIAAHEYPLDPRHLVELRAAAALLDAAIVALRAYLAQLEHSERVIDEYESLVRYQELLARELSLLPAGETA